MVISTVPVFAGATAMITVGPGCEPLVAETVPNFTPVTFTKSVPVMVTIVPTGPNVGEIDVTAGTTP